MPTPSQKPKPTKLKPLWLSACFIILPIIVIIACIYTQTINKNKYLVIKEWGVRFELPKSIRGKVAYKMQYTDDRFGYLYFYVPALAAKEHQCGADPRKDEAGLGLELTRVNKDEYGEPPSMSSLYQIDGMGYGIITKIVDYYFSVRLIAYPSADTPRDQRLPIAKKLPIGCYQASYPNKPDPKDPIWQESKTIYRTLQPATYTLEKIPQ